MTEEMRKAEFADFLGVSRAYISQLSKADRLVLSADGKVLVQQTLERIASTSDAGKVGVAAKHALERWKKGGHGVAVVDIARTASPSSPAAAPEPLQPAAAAGQHSSAAVLMSSGDAIGALNLARAANEIKRGEQLDIDLAKARASLISREATVLAVSDLAAATRAAFERIPDRIATQVAAESDPRVVYAMLEQAIDLCCETLSSQVGGVIEKLM